MKYVNKTLKFKIFIFAHLNQNEMYVQGYRYTRVHATPRRYMRTISIK